MTYFLSFYSGLHLYASFSFSADDDRAAVAVALDHDMLADEAVDGWTMCELYSGRNIEPTDADYR